MKRKFRVVQKTRGIAVSGDAKENYNPGLPQKEKGKKENADWGRYTGFMHG